MVTKSVNIYLKDMRDVQSFVVTLYKYDDVSCKAVQGRYAVDAKSIIGLYTLDLNKELIIEAKGTDKDVDAFIKEISIYSSK